MEKDRTVVAVLPQEPCEQAWVCPLHPVSGVLSVSGQVFGAACFNSTWSPQSPAFSADLFVFPQVILEKPCLCWSLHDRDRAAEP